MLRAYSGYVPWAANSQIGIEIQDLIHPDAVTPAMPDPVGGLEDFWSQALLRFSLPISFHGPATSEPLYDPERRESALAHLTRAMDAAAGLGARYFLVHPELRLPAAERGAGGALAVWEAVLHEAKARNLVLLLENTGEESPDRLRSLSAAIESPALGLCLDVGHAHLHSRIALEDWLSAFGNDLLYVHLYNVAGGSALHRALGDGEIRIGRFLEQLAKSRPDVRVCLEMDLGRIVESLKWLEREVGSGKSEGGR